jgi:predicted oxidoreductase
MTDIHLSPDPRPLGKSGLTVSPIAWGMWRFARAGADDGQRLIETALDIGINLFDTADIYGFDTGTGFGNAEKVLGEVLTASPGLRDRMVIATKGGIQPGFPYDSSRTHLMTALDDSLRRLRVERVDLYQVHRPDILAHPQEVARTLEDMVASGKVAAVGISNYTPAQTRALLGLITIALASHQPEFSPLHLDPIDNGLLDVTMEHDVAVLAWSPMGGGRIAKPADERATRVVEVLDRVAVEQGVSRAAATHSWIMAHPARIIPIAGTLKVERVAELAEAYKVVWTRKAWYEVLVASRGERLP